MTREMKRERIHQLVDLVLDTKSNEHMDIVQITVSNDGDHEIYVHPDVINGGRGTIYSTYRYAINRDPDLTEGEARIMRLREGVKE